MSDSDADLFASSGAEESFTVSATPPLTSTPARGSLQGDGGGEEGRGDVTEDRGGAADEDESLRDELTEGEASAEGLEESLVSVADAACSPMCRAPPDSVSSATRSRPQELDIGSPSGFGPSAGRRQSLNEDESFHSAHSQPDLPAQAASAQSPDCEEAADHPSQSPAQEDSVGSPEPMQARSSPGSATAEEESSGLVVELGTPELALLDEETRRDVEMFRTLYPETPITSVPSLARRVLASAKGPPPPAAQEPSQSCAPVQRDLQEVPRTLDYADDEDEAAISQSPIGGSPSPGTSPKTGAEKGLSRGDQSSWDGDESELFEKYIQENRKKMAARKPSPEPEKAEAEEEEDDDFVCSDEEVEWESGDEEDEASGSDESYRASTGSATPPSSDSEESPGPSRKTNGEKREDPSPGKSSDSDEEDDVFEEIWPQASKKSWDASDPDAVFLGSLDSEEGKRGFARRREELSGRLLELFNRRVFGGRLPAALRLEWNARLRKTAGLCRLRRGEAWVELSPKVLDSPARLRDTLAHELCHVAVFLLDGRRDDKHGPLWRGWAGEVGRAFPALPPVARCHRYAIAAKFAYKCGGCGQLYRRHSKSIDVERKCCGACQGRLALQTPATPRPPNRFALFVKQHYREQRTPGSAHKDAMAALGQRFRSLKVANVPDDPPPQGDEENQPPTSV